MSEQRTAPTIRFGEVFAEHEGVVDAHDAVAFAVATNAPQPAYLDGRAIPPLYSAVLVLPSLNENLRHAVDDGVVIGKAEGFSGVHAEHDVTFHTPLHPDQKVRWDARVRSCSVNSAGTLVTQQLLISDLEGAPLIEHLWSTMAIKATTDCTGGPPLPDHRYPADARQKIIGSETLDISRDQGRIYFEAAGDAAGHSLSDEIARAEGHPGMILQGMCSFAMCTGAVVRIAGGGNPDRLRRLAARFSAPVILGQQLLVEVGEVGTTEDGTYVVAFEARQGNRVCITNGRAEFRSLD